MCNSYVADVTVKHTVLVQDVLKLKSGGEAVLQEYQETETLTEVTRRQMINTLVAHMIDTCFFVFL